MRGFWNVGKLCKFFLPLWGKAARGGSVKQLLQYYFKVSPSFPSDYGTVSYH